MMLSSISRDYQLTSVTFSFSQCFTSSDFASSFYKTPHQTYFFWLPSMFLRPSLVATDFIDAPLPRFLILAYVRKRLLTNVKDVSNPIPLELPVTTATFWLDEDNEDVMYHSF